MKKTDPRRVTTIREGSLQSGPVLYWMSRDQRARDNWALLHAQSSALESASPLGVVFCLTKSFLGARREHYNFMINGLLETAALLEKNGIPFFLLEGKPETEIPKFISKCGAGLLVTDFDPLKIKRRWQMKVARNINIPFHEVDAHNIVPCRVASPKQEFAAYTFRPKINRLLPEFLVSTPRLRKHPHKWPGRVKRPESLFQKQDAHINTYPFKPGEAAAGKTLRSFIRSRLAGYDPGHNDPNEHGQSDLSPYIHFGQISPQKIAWEVSRSEAPEGSMKAFLEELIVRRELSDNFCFYNDKYDSYACFPDWAKKSLKAHARNRREYRYSIKQFESAETHDPLWNAAQIQMVVKGKMHGYMRMYWGKKILEWTADPEEAFENALLLNNRYELDGRDPNGYCGVAWCIGGLHDRAWPERPVFGKIRYMNDAGCRRKFNVEKYIENNSKELR